MDDLQGTEKGWLMTLSANTSFLSAASLGMLCSPEGALDFMGRGWGDAVFIRLPLPSLFGFCSNTYFILKVMLIGDTV